VWHTDGSQQALFAIQSASSLSAILQSRSKERGKRVLEEGAAGGCACSQLCSRERGRERVLVLVLVLVVLATFAFKGEGEGSGAAEAALLAVRGVCDEIRDKIEFTYLRVRVVVVLVLAACIRI
jgi:hypothetical protein